MRNLELLRRTLDDQAAAAPDGVGFVEAAHAGVARIRTRRRVIVAAMAVTLAAGAAITPTAISRLLPAGSAEITSPTPAPRGPFQLTVDVARNSGYSKTQYGVIGPQQHLSLRSTVDTEEWPTEVVVQDPNTFDAAAFQRGERVTVRGHPAYYVTNFLVGVIVGTVMPPIDPTRREEVRVSAVGWPEPSGAWVIVYVNTPQQSRSEPRDKAQLLRVAGLVRIGAPRDLRMSFQLGYRPRGMDGQWARVVGVDHVGLSSIGLGPQPSTTDMFAWEHGELDQPLRVYVEPISDMSNDVLQTLGPPEARIAGYDTWYNTEGTPGWQVAHNTGHIMFAAGTCWVQVSSSDLTQVPYEELKRVVEGARFADCTQPGTWLRPLS